MPTALDTARLAGLRAGARGDAPTPRRDYRPDLSVAWQRGYARGLELRRAAQKEGQR